MQLVKQWIETVIMNLVFDNAMLNQPSLSHSVLPPELENNHNIDVLDDDMLIVSDMDLNIIQNGLSPEHQLLQNKKRDDTHQM